MTARFAVLVCLVAGAGFAAGRWWPAAPPTDARASQARPSSPAAPPSSADERPSSTPSASRAGSRSSDRPSLGATQPEVLGKKLSPSWVTVALRDPDGARALSSAVISALELRRGGRDGGRECFPPDFAGDIWLRFEADVEVHDTTLAIGPGRFVEVADGVPVPTATTECIEHLLAGNDDIHVADAKLPDGYRGPVEYRVGYAFRE